MGILVLKKDFRLEWVSDTWPIAKTMSVILFLKSYFVGIQNTS